MKRSLLFGLGLAIPVVIAAVAIAWIALPQADRRIAAHLASGTVPSTSETPRSTSTERSPAPQTATPRPTRPSTPTSTSSAPSVATTSPPPRRPQGTVTISDFTNHESERDNCSYTTLLIVNRSDTPVKDMTIRFKTSYTPKGADSTVEKDGPMETMTEPLGIAPFQSQETVWQVCAPELHGKADTVGGIFEELDAVPVSYSWRWFDSGR